MPKAHVSYGRDKADVNHPVQIAVLVHDAGESLTPPHFRAGVGTNRLTHAADAKPLEQRGGNPMLGPWGSDA
jgi:hypothetical protein